MYLVNKILVIIPAYNEEDSIERVADQLIREYPQLDYVIINDGSRDRTGEICRDRGYNCIELPINLGLEGTFRAGMKYAYYKGYEYAVQYDGDGQHNPEYIIPMSEYANDNNLDIVVGSRFIDEKKAFNMRMIGNSILGVCIWLTTGKRIMDPTSGMRMYNRTIIRKFAILHNYGPEPDTLVFLMRSGAKVGEFKVHMNEREYGESYLNLTSSIAYMFRMTVSILVVQWFRKRV